MSLEDRAKDVQAWHVKAFPWAGIRDVALKLKEEAEELAKAETPQEIRDELADCAIAILAAAGVAKERLGIELDAAIYDKLPRVMDKHKPK